MIHLSDNLKIDLQPFTRRKSGERIGVLGASGSGKTFTVARVLEGWATSFPFVIIDPMGHLAEMHFTGIVAGADDECDLQLTLGNAAALADLVVDHRISCVLDLLAFDDDDDYMPILEAFLSQFWTRLKLAKNVEPWALVVDEAHDLLPQQGTTPVSKFLTRFGKQGRHWNITSIFATQRPASLSKDWLTQAGMIVAHQLMLGNDTKILTERLPMSNREVNAMMEQLVPGEAVIVGRQSLTGTIGHRRVQVVKPNNLHDDSTTKPVRPTPPINDALRDALNALSSLETIPAEPDEVTKLNEKISQLEAQIDDLNLEMQSQKSRYEAEINARDKRIESLQTQVQTLGAIQITTAGERITTIRDLQAHQIRAGKLAVGGSDIEAGISELPLFRKKPETVLEPQRRHFQALLEDVNKSRYWQRRMLRFLMERENRAFRVRDMAKHLGISTKTLTSNPPLDLIKLGLISRTGKTANEFTYKSKARSGLRAQFPDLHVEDMVDDLLKALPATR